LPQNSTQLVDFVADTFVMFPSLALTVSGFPTMFPAFDATEQAIRGDFAKCTHARLA
jgi:hypothetical protein